VLPDERQVKGSVSRRVGKGLLGPLTLGRGGQGEEAENHSEER